MKKVLTILLLTIGRCVCLCAYTAEMDSLLKILDQTLLESEVYMKQKEHRIERLKRHLKNESSKDKLYEYSSEIIEEYKSYNCDSALVYIDRNLLLSEKTGNRCWFAKTKLQYSFVLSSSGLFRESEANMKSIRREDLTPDIIPDYYKCYEQLYVNLCEYLADKRFTDEHQEKIQAYRDSVLMSLPETSPERLFYQSQIEQSKGQTDKAFKNLSDYWETLQPGTHEHAKMSARMSGFYKNNDPEKRVKYLAIAALSDIKDAIKENKALLDLAIWFYGQGDIPRAYQYIQYALNDANFYNARFRNFQISRALPIITEAYQRQSDSQKQSLQVALTISSVLFIILFITLFFVRKQMKALSAARLHLKKANNDLSRMNIALSDMNRDLSEANRVKEEYIGHFMDLCSEFINRLEDYRKMINNKIAAKRFDELLRMTSSPRGKASEVKELYDNFDAAFLNIYPGFVSALNEYLKEEEKFDTNRGELLNTELRVFALIRLGISDSTKIASFLRCSVQTVYNYRSKMRKKCLNENLDIEKVMKKIGYPSSIEEK